MAGGLRGGGGSGSTRRRRRARGEPMSEINVTPFVDVMLVLLIVFMVSAPLLSAGVPIDLPEAPANPLTLSSEPVTVTIDPDGRVFVGDNDVDFADLIPALDAMLASRDERVYVRGDRAASYGTIMRVMGTMNGAGFRNIGLVALKEPES